MEDKKLQRKCNFWFGTAMVLTGIIIGYFVAPMKNGINVKNICGNSYGANDDFDEEGYADEGYEIED